MPRKSELCAFLKHFCKYILINLANCSHFTTSTLSFNYSLNHQNGHYMSPFTLPTTSTELSFKTLSSSLIIMFYSFSEECWPLYYITFLLIFLLPRAAVKFLLALSCKLWVDHRHDLQCKKIRQAFISIILSVFLVLFLPTDCTIDGDDQASLPATPYDQLFFHPPTIFIVLLARLVLVRSGSDEKPSLWGTS